MKALIICLTYWQCWFASYGDTLWIDTANEKVFYSLEFTPASYEQKMKRDPMLMFFDFVKVRRVRRRKKYETNE